MKEHPRLARERRTILAMQVIYCREQHGRSENTLCPECQGLYDYAMQRLKHCPYQESKPTCANCPIHCYKPDMRERVRRMMRYSGPRMIFRHPWLAFAHLLDGRKRAPAMGSRRRTHESAD